jgi:hypothetical protein
MDMKAYNEMNIVNINKLFALSQMENVIFVFDRFFVSDWHADEVDGKTIDFPLIKNILEKENLFRSKFQRFEK